MSPPDSGSGQPDPSQTLAFQEIIDKIQSLSVCLSKASTTEKNVATDPIIKGKEEKKEDHKDEISKEGQFDHQKVIVECKKLSEDIVFIKLAFQDLYKFDDGWMKPLEALEKNVEGCVNNISAIRHSWSSVEQLKRNLCVLKRNIVRIKILLHDSATQRNIGIHNFEETVFKREDDLPKLHREELKLEQSPYCRELFQKYEKLLDLRLQMCLLSFAVFPANAEVKKRLLRYWWVGEDIIPPERGEEEFANETLERLVELEFIKRVDKKDGLSTTSYTMNSFVHSALISLARKEQFFDYDRDGNPTMNLSKCYKACLVKESPRSISEHFSKYKDELGKLETLFNISTQLLDLKEKWFSKMKRIKVLYLGGWESSTNRYIFVQSTFEGLSKIKYLRFLSLQGISGIETLPNSLCKAAKLRILDLRACHDLQKLPDNIGSLKKLIHLDVSECNFLTQMPKELSFLSELRVFKGFVISDQKNTCSLEELTALEKLEKLSINIIDKEYKTERLGIDISKFEKLKKLKVTWGGATLTPAGAEEKSEESSGRTESQGQGGQHKSQVKKGTAATQLAIPNEKKNSGKPYLVPKKLWGKLKNKNKESDAAQSTVSSQERTDSSDNLSSFRISGRVTQFTSKLRGAVESTSKRAQGPNLAEVCKPKGDQWNVTKLELQCYPEATAPCWLVPEVLPELNSLYIKGGRLHNLPEIRTEWKHVETLRLKYLSDLKTEWKELREMFPALVYLERVRCPKVMFCPCDGNAWRHLTPLLKDGVEN